jgi:uncharacterized protein (DUF1330 family)
MKEPTREQIEALASYPADQKVVMINILKYKSRVHGSSESGEAAYRSYMAKAAPFVEKVGARLLWKGSITHVVIGDDSLKPDSLVLIEYPSIASFFQLVSDPGFQEVNKERGLALEYGGILAAIPEMSAGFDG